MSVIFSFSWVQTSEKYEIAFENKQFEMKDVSVLTILSLSLQLVKEWCSIDCITYTVSRSEIFSLLRLNCSVPFVRMRELPTITAVSHRPVNFPHVHSASLAFCRYYCFFFVKRLPQFEPKGLFEVFHSTIN